MIMWLILIGLFMLIIYCIFILKLRIKWKTFIKKGFRPVRGDFGLYCYTGNQGVGKTYSLAEYIYDNPNCVYFLNLKNIKSLTYLQDINNPPNGTIGIFFKGFKGLVEQKELIDSGYYDEIIKGRKIVFIYDELFSELMRNTTLSLPVQDFLSQLRKRKINFLTTAQIWSEIPLFFRKMCRYQINCKMIPLVFTGFLLKEFRDAENMKWDNELQEHVAPTIELTLTKTRKKVSESYNTMERIVAEKS